MTVIEALIFVVVTIVSACFFYTFFVVLPVKIYADMKCAEAGYPKAKVTVNLKRYCLNLDGSVTVKIEKLK